LGRKTIFYDEYRHGEYTSAGEVRDQRSAESSVNEYNRTAFEYDRLAPLIWGQYNPDDQLFIGGGFLYIKQGFRKDPFGQRHVFLASIAPATQSFNFQYQARFTRFAGKWNLDLDADLKSPNYVNNFFGLGNESVFDKNIDEVPGVGVDNPVHYYRYRFEELALFAGVSREIGSIGTIRFGPLYQRVEMEEPDEEDRFITEYAEALPTDQFYENTPYFGMGWQMSGGKRDNSLFTQRGLLWSVSGRNLAGLTKEDFDFSSYEASLSIFHSRQPRARLVFAMRFGGGLNHGKYPFYQAQILDGKTALRGYRKTRFYGDSKAYGNLEVRLRLMDFRSYLFPASFGILGFYDVGRVWYKDSSGVDPSAPGGKSALWHQGVGGGLWFTPFNLTVLSVEAGHSREGTLGYVRLGFLF
jgi:outer membrane protein assembly factor BamA